MSPGPDKMFDNSVDLSEDCQQQLDWVQMNPEQHHYQSPYSFRLPRVHLHQQDPCGLHNHHRHNFHISDKIHPQKYCLALGPRLQQNRQRLIEHFRRIDRRLPASLNSARFVRASIKLCANFKFGKIPVHYSGLLAVFSMLILALFNCCTNLYPLADDQSVPNSHGSNSLDVATYAAIIANNQSWIDSLSDNSSCFLWKESNLKQSQKFDLVTVKKCMEQQNSARLLLTGSSKKSSASPNQVRMSPVYLYGLLFVGLYLMLAIFGSKLFKYQIRVVHQEDGDHVVKEIIHTSSNDFDEDKDQGSILANDPNEAQQVYSKTIDRLRHPNLEPIITEMKLSVVSLLPLRLLSRIWGHMVDARLPRRLRPVVYHRYAQWFGCNLDEIEETDLTRYKNLGQFFRRALKPNVRPITPGSGVVVSPADGKVVQLEQVSAVANSQTNNEMLTNGYVGSVKGIYYSVDNFLGPNFMAHMRSPVNGSLRATRPNNSLYSCVVYLAPGDYHRFHSPIEWKIYSRRHFPGKLLSVEPTFVGKVPNLFSTNERVVYLGRWKYGFFSMTAVGAYNVGSIRAYFDPDLHTNQAFHGRHYRTEKIFNAGRGIRMTKGEAFGEFNMGSTMVLIFEAPSDRIQLETSVGNKIQYGQSVCQILPK